MTVSHFLDTEDRLTNVRAPVFGLGHESGRPAVCERNFQRLGKHGAVKHSNLLQVNPSSPFVYHIAKPGCRQLGLVLNSGNVPLPSQVLNNGVRNKVGHAVITTDILEIRQRVWKRLRAGPGHREH